MAQRATSLWYFTKAATTTSGNAGAVQNFTLSIGMGHLGGSSGAETGLQIPFRTAGTLSGLMIRVTANSFSNAVTFKSRIAAADANQVVTVGAGLTGDFQDTTHSDAIAGTGDLVDVMLNIPAQSASFTYAICSFKFLATATTDTVVRHHSLGSSTTAAPGTTHYKSLTSLGSTQTVEAREQFKVKLAGTYKNFFANISTNTLSTASTTFRLRKNTANGNCNVVVGAGLTGIFEDTSNTDTVAVDDLVNTQSVIGSGGTGTISYGNVGVAFVTTSGNYHLVSATHDGTSFNSGTTTYIAIGGALTPTSTTEDTAKALAGIGAIYSNLEVNVITNTLAGAATLKTRKNSANGGQSISIGAGLTGWFEDTSNTDSLAATDYVAYQLVTPAPGGTAIRINNLAVVVNPTTQLLSGVDSGTGTDTGGKVIIKTTDSGTGTDVSSVSQTTTKAVTDSGTGTETSRVELTTTDSATGVDTATPTAQIHRTDSGSGTEGIPQITQKRTDQATGVDQASVQATQQLSDAATGSETSRIVLKGVDAATATEAAATTAQIHRTDSGAGFEDSTVDTGGLLNRNVQDSGIATEVAAVEAHPSATDQATGSEQASPRATVAPSDQGTATESAQTSSSRARTDTGVGADVASTRATSVSSDAATGTEAPSQIIQKRADQGAGTEAGTVGATSRPADTGVGVESARVSPHAADAAAAVEAAIVIIRSSDSGVGIESSSISAIIQAADQGLGADFVSRREFHLVDSGIGSEDRAVIPLLKGPFTTGAVRSSLTITTPVKGSITSTRKVVP